MSQSQNLCQYYNQLYNDNKFITTNLYFNLVCPGRSLLEYCRDIALKSFSPRPVPPRAGSNVGRAAVVILFRFSTV